MKVHEYEIKEEKGMDECAKSLLKLIQHPLILLVGELGAGKTTLVKAMLRNLKSSDTGSSPSYALINKYQIPEGTVFHLDLYRLNSVEEIYQLGIEEIFEQGTYCFIEWPEKILPYLSRSYHKIEIEVTENQSRKINFNSVDIE